MRRREFVGLLGATAAWPLATRAAGTPLIGYVGYRSLSDTPPQQISAFQEGLKSVGYVDGKNAVIEYRSADGQSDRLPVLFSDLVRRNVTVIFTAGNVAVSAAKATTSRIPIVFYIATDPVAMGYVAGMNRPGANLTGVSIFNISLGAKQVEMLHQLLRPDGAIALLSNPENPSAHLHVKEIRDAAQKLGRDIRLVTARQDGDIAEVFVNVVRYGIGAMIVDDDAFFNSRKARLVELATENRIETVFSNREFVAAGGLMSYGTDLVDAYRLCGVYTGRILQGDKAADLPVIQPKVEFVINLKTAKALGISIPPTLLAAADEVIE
jgi:putative ABC transport system substrate-binding protein